MKIQLTEKLLILPAVLMLALGAPMTQADAPAPNENQAKYEVRFLKGMIDHHAMAVMTGMMCEERAIHEELRELCHEIVAAQTAEIEMMQGWLEEWYGITHEPVMKRGAEKKMEQMGEMEGEEFEIEFMTMMIRHHEKAVREGIHCQARAYHEELIELCEDIVETQAAEIALMESWLCDWYEICD
jgi:uncharacterized protein (DUF305 family)